MGVSHEGVHILEIGLQ